MYNFIKKTFGLACSKGLRYLVTYACWSSESTLSTSWRGKRSLGRRIYRVPL